MSERDPYYAGRQASGPACMLWQYNDGNKISVQQMIYLIFMNIKLFGPIVKGRGEASSVLNFPTLNMIPEKKPELKNGVYGAKAKLNGKKFFGVLYIGKRPTFDNSDISWEINLFGYEKGEKEEYIEVEILFFIRPDMKFSSVEELKQQQSKDKEFAMSKFGHSNPE